MNNKLYIKGTDPLVVAERRLAGVCNEFTSLSDHWFNEKGALADGYNEYQDIMDFADYLVTHTNVAVLIEDIE